MRRLLLALVLANAAGCIIQSDDDSTGANLLVTWSLEALSNQIAQQCPVGYDTAAVYSQEIDGSGDAVGDPIIDLFNCSDGQGVTSMLSGITYLESVAIAVDDNSLQYGTSVPVPVDIMAPEQEVDTPPIYTDAGHFELAWQLTQAGDDVGCGDVPDAFSVQVTSTDASGPTVSAPLPCTDGSGYTDGVLDGTYTVTVALLDATGNQLGVSDPLTGTIATTSMQGNTITDLHTVTIPVQ
ncbi:MAG TPA: hypothetical protein VH143_05670 [Kofleriaceae bacterium]|jgi:hypothetical protein|nr:hypothetical protein [Kofleriaceae bacterium]